MWSRGGAEVDEQEFYLISQLDLVNPRESGGRIRDYCPIHGGDRQRSLSIDMETGFGYCHQCKRKVLVREMNRDAAARLEEKQAQEQQGVIHVRDPKYIAREAKPKEEKVSQWRLQERALLLHEQKRMVSRLRDERARAYIQSRGLALETVEAQGLGYIPAMALTGKYEPIAKWADHIIIPVESAQHGLHFVGRNLRLWVPGMDENEHKRLLDEKYESLLDAAEQAKKRGDAKGEDAAEREANLYIRYYKTHKAGWLNYQALVQAPYCVIVEGAFDALAMIETGIPHAVAIIGTAIEYSWIPKEVRHVLLALDGDQAGREKSVKHREQLHLRGFEVSLCCPPQDDKGKDWSERYRLQGSEGLQPLFDAVAAIMASCEGLTPFCNTCLDTGHETEASHEHEGLMYCDLHALGQSPEPEPEPTREDAIKIVSRMDIRDAAREMLEAEKLQERARREALQAQKSAAREVFVL